MNCRQSIPVYTRAIAPIIIFTALFFLSLTASAQPYTSAGGRFQVDQIQGCAPFTVKIVNTFGECTAVPGHICNMDYENGKGCPGDPFCQNVLTYTYTTPGTYKLSVLFQNTGADFIMVTVLPNIQPNFDVYSCSGNRVSIVIRDTNYDKYFVNFGDGSPTDSLLRSANMVMAHTYAVSGTYPIAVHGKDFNSADNCNAQVVSFNAIQVLPTPFINLATALDPSRLELRFTAAPHLQLKLEIAYNNSTNFQYFRTLYGVSKDTLTSLKLDQTYYCYRLNAYDPCSGANTYSNVVCSQQFSAVAQSDVNQLNWVTSATGVTDYSISRNQAPYVNEPTQSYNDVAIVCLTHYCYQITTNYANGSKSISLEKCVDSFTLTVPDPVQDASAVVDDSKVSLTWLQSPAFTPNQYLVNRNSNSGSFDQIGTTAVPSFDDGGYSTDGNYCYRVHYRDVCDNFSPPGVIFCPIRLTGTLDRQNVITLRWNDYTGWKNGVSMYTLEKFDKDGNLLKTYNVALATSFVDNEDDFVNQIVSYKLTAIPVDPGLTPSVSNIARFIKGVNLFYPTAFTPNGDQLNDVFNVSGHFIITMELFVFDRWGNLIFSSRNDESWDGTYQGKAMPETTYVWKAEGNDVAGQKFSNTGTVVLLRKK